MTTNPSFSRKNFLGMVFALALGGWPVVCRPCSVSSVLHGPYDVANSYGFYGEVIGHVSMRIPGCEHLQEAAACSPSWGLRIRILEPLNVPARGVSEVEYYSFGTRSDCRAVPMPQEDVQRQYPAGTRIALAAVLFAWDEPRPPRIRLTSLRPIVGEAIYIVPKGVELKTLAAKSFDYFAYLGSREPMLSGEDRNIINFELWRDTLRLHQSKNERDALAILSRMATVVRVMGIFSEDAYYTPIEQLVDQFLPTPATRAEFARRLRDAAGSQLPGQVPR